MGTKGKRYFLFATLSLVMWQPGAWLLLAQQTAAAAGTGNTQAQNDPLAELSPENRVLFGVMREAVQQGKDAVVVTNGKKLLPALKPNTALADFVADVTAGSALETGDIDYALSLIKPVAERNPTDWHAAVMLARLYAESGDKKLRDQQIARVLYLHKHTTDPGFAKLHIFPIQKVKLRSGYANFLYPFEPLKPYNTYLVALINTDEGEGNYRIELGSEDADQAFFKAKHPGERRFSIDSYRKNKTNPDASESQALHGFVDGVFDYDYMRDCLVNTANGAELPRR